MKPRIIFIHGNQATSWAFAWTPWLKKQLDDLGYETVFQTFPDPKWARASIWLPHLKETLKAGPNDILVGWSSGAVAAMRYAEQNQIKASILVAPSYTDLGDELEKKSEYFDAPWNWEAIQKNQEKIVLIHSDNDPFIPTEEFTTIATELKVTEILLKGEGHFMEKHEFPEILQQILHLN